MPQGFSLNKVLPAAKEIKLATAFAHRSGWTLIKEPILKSQANVFLLAGRDCYQTEPKLLKDWLELQLKTNHRVNAHLATDETFFHPKVLVVSFEQSKRDFAVVGSGNLSEGGLSTNTECSLFISDGSAVKHVTNWFDTEFKKGLELNSTLIAVYESDYKKNRDKRIALVKRDAETGKKLKAAGEATMASWQDATKAAKKYFASKGFPRSYKDRQDGAKRIKDVLNAPEFNFDKFGWHLFYTVAPLGQLDERYRDRVWKNQQRLKKALRQLAKNPESALPRVLNRDGDLHVPGAGLNTISKILASLFPKDWPVYNGRVPLALAKFGYRHPRCATTAEKYLAYRNIMKRFAEACGTNGTRPDVLALDAFILMRSKLSDKKKAKKPVKRK